MDSYSVEQQINAADDERGLSADLRPWLQTTIGAAHIESEFPYYQIAGQDIPVEEVPRAHDWLQRHADSLEDVPRSLRRQGPYRTDIVALTLDADAVRTRYARIGELTSMNGSRSAKRRRRRTYCNFLRDGPMTRAYYEEKHGSADGDGELHGYGKSSASRGFTWLQKRGFLAAIDGGYYDAVTLPFAFDTVHAIEIKIQSHEWDTALEQAQRAACYADAQWVAMGHESISPALNNQEAFKKAGVGLLRVSPADGVSAVVDAPIDPPTLTERLLNHYNVARWDINERFMDQISRANSDSEEGSGSVQVDVSDTDLVARPPLAHGGTPIADQPAYEKTTQTGLSEF